MIEKINGVYQVSEKKKREILKKYNAGIWPTTLAAEEGISPEAMNGLIKRWKTGKEGNVRKYWSVWDGKTDEPVIIHGSAAECYKAMMRHKGTDRAVNIDEKRMARRFYGILTKFKQERTKAWAIVYEDDEGDCE